MAKKLAIFASGAGSNYDAIMNAIDAGSLDAEVVLLVCDRLDAKVIDKARRNQTPTFAFNPKNYPSKVAFEQEILANLLAEDVEWIILAGYMRLVGPTLLSVYKSKIINIHPSLLPAFPGKDAIGQAFRAGVKVTGVTIHFVDEGMDTGKIIDQESLRITDGESRDSLQRRVQVIEHRLYPKTIQSLIEKREGQEKGSMIVKKRALLSVSDKSGLVEFAQGLDRLGYELISTGGTLKKLKEAGLPALPVSAVTNFDEILDGRVKTLHPFIHAGLLAKRDDESHQQQLLERDIHPIDVVVVNLYPFKQTIEQEGVTEAEAIENIDIGGPTMLRAAAKNFQDVSVIVDPADYADVLAELTKDQPSVGFRKQLAAKVFRHTANYDAMIANYFTEITDEKDPETYTVTYEKVQSLRYGENPHQQAAFYQEPNVKGASLANAKQLHGKELSYNNIQDANAALEIVLEYSEPAAVAVKHMNPCGVGIGGSISEAYSKAYEADPVSIFGGIVALNREVDERTASQLKDIFLEIVIAPSFSAKAIEILTAKKNIRLLETPMENTDLSTKKVVSVVGGLLVQDRDNGAVTEEDLTFPTDRKPNQKELDELLFAWKVVKHVKSNAIVVAKGDQTLGVGAGQMNRVGAAKIAFEQAGEKAKGAVMSSDAFFPMGDTVEAAAKAGITAIIQPGGSIRDQDSIDACNKHGIAMVFTGMRHFKH